MDGRRALTVDPARDRVPTIERLPAARRSDRLRALAARSRTKAADARSCLRDRLTTGWALALGAGWPLAFVATAAIEPAPADPDAAVPPIVALGSLVFLTALVVTVAAAATRLRLAAPAGVVTGAVALAFALSCPLSGHHSYGLWWIGEVAVFGAMTAISTAALGRRALAATREPVV